MSVLGFLFNFFPSQWIYIFKIYLFILQPYCHFLSLLTSHSLPSTSLLPTPIHPSSVLLALGTRLFILYYLAQS